MRYSAIVTLTLCLSIPFPALNYAAQAIHTPSTPDSLAPRLTSAPDGTPWLSWLEPDGSGYVLKFSAFRDRKFEPARTIARGNNWFTNWADTPHLFVAEAGRMAAHWLQKSADSPYAYDIHLSLSNDHGRSWSPGVTPHHDGTPTEHGFVSFFPQPSGIGLVWLDGRATAGSSGHGSTALRSTTFKYDGTQGTELELDSRICDCCQTGAVMTERGAAVVYRDRSDDEIRDIAFVHQTAAGWSQPIPVHRDAWEIEGCPVNGPQLVSLGDEVAVAWFTMANQVAALKVARSTSGMTAFSPPQVLARATPIGRVAIAATDHYIAISWIEEIHGKAKLKLAWLQRSDFSELQRSSVAELPPGRASGFPTIAPLNDDQVLLSWVGQKEQQSVIHASVFRAHQ